MSSRFLFEKQNEDYITSVWATVDDKTEKEIEFQINFIQLKPEWEFVDMVNVKEKYAIIELFKQFWQKLGITITDEDIKNLIIEWDKKNEEEIRLVNEELVEEGLII